MKHITTLLLIFLGTGAAFAQGRIDIPLGGSFSANGGCTITAGGSGAGEEVDFNNQGTTDLSGGTVSIYGNVDNDGDMDLSNGDVDVYGNVDNDGDMDLSNGDVDVYRPAGNTNVTNGANNPGNTRLTLDGSRLYIGHGVPNTGSGNFNNHAGGAPDGNVGSNTTGVVSGSGRSTVIVNGNVDNDGDMDLSNGDVDVYGNVDNDGDMDLSNGDVDVYRAGNANSMNNGTTQSQATIVLNGSTLRLGTPRIGLPLAGSAGNFNNHGGTVDGNASTNTFGVVSNNVNPVRNTVVVNGNVDNDGDMDLSNGDVDVYGNVDNDGDMDLSNGDVDVYRAGNSSGVTNGPNSTGSSLVLNGTTLNIGTPRSPSLPDPGSSGFFTNHSGTVDGNVGSNTFGVVTNNGNPSTVVVNGNVDNDGDMDLSNGDVDVYGNVDNDGDMDLSNGDVDVYRAGAPAGVTNGSPAPTPVTNSALVLNGTTLTIGAPRSPAVADPGSSGTFTNHSGTVDGNVGSNTTGVVSNNTHPVRNIVTVNGNVDNDGDMDLSNGDVDVYGNVDNDGDMDLSNGDVDVYRPGPGTGNVNNNAPSGTLVLSPSDGTTAIVRVGGDMTNGGTVETSPSGTFGSQIVFNGNPNTQTFTPGTSDFQNVQVGTTTPSVTSNVIVNGDLRITNEVRVENGDITTNTGAGNTVTLINNAVLSGENTNNSLNGRIVNEQNMGTNTSESFGGNLGITILNPSAINLGTVTVRRFTGLGVGLSYIDNTILTDRKSIDATYQIESSTSPGGVIGGTVQIQFNWQSSQDNGVDLGYTGLNSVYTTSNATLPAPVGAAPAAGGWDKIDGLTVVNATNPVLPLGTDMRQLTVSTNHFSFWTPGGFMLGVLAVDWSDASAYLVPNPAPELTGMPDAVQVDWATAAEYYVDHFSVEHSIDGKSFQEVGTVGSAHNSFDLNTYSFVHDHPEYNLNYYRIKVYDMDGGQSTSQVMAVAVSKNDAFTLTYPNPMAEGSQLGLYLRQDAEVHAQLFTSDGRLIGSFLEGNLKGSQTYKVSFPVQEMAQGVYILKLNVNGEIQAHRIVIE